jgi:hypothetical protein
MHETYFWEIREGYVILRRLVEFDKINNYIEDLYTLTPELYQKLKKTMDHEKNSY